MHRDSSGNYSIYYKRLNEQLVSLNDEGKKAIRLGAGWKMISI